MQNHVKPRHKSCIVVGHTYMTDILLTLCLKNIRSIFIYIVSLIMRKDLASTHFKVRNFIQVGRFWPSKLLRPSELGGGPLCHEANCPLKWPTCLL